MADQGNKRGYWDGRWQPYTTISGIDSETPVADLHDVRTYGRDGLVLLSDEERDIFAWSLDQAQRKRELGIVEITRQAWHQTLWGRIGVATGLVLVVIEIVRTALGH